MNETLKADLQSLKGDLILFKPSIKEVARDIIKEGVSEYPIFIAHQIKIPIGEIILDHTELAMSWSVSASTIEEFMEHQLIEVEKEDLFKANYKDPEKNICIFMISEGGASFVFVPYEININPDEN
jgi:hypothetical protein